MYNVRFRTEETPVGATAHGYGVAVRPPRTKVHRFGSLIQAQESAKRLMAVRRLA